MRLSELDGRRVGIWGAGREGRAASVAVERAGGRVEVMATEESGLDRLGGCEVVIRSPGVSRYRPELQALADSGVLLTTGTNLFFAEPRSAGVLGVSGTKGKSTTSAMLAHLLRFSGASVELGGNIGLPLLELLERPEPGFFVVELSSFQISDLERGPDVAVMLNLYREHLDWHGSEDAYRADKLRLLGLPGVCVAVINGRDERLARTVGSGVEVLTFGSGALPGIEGLPVRGEHNRLNLAAALTAAEAVGIRPDDVAAAMAGFQALPHRLETVTEVGGVTWVNDSIATTPESTIAALGAFSESPVTLLAGGFDRGQDYEELGRAIVRHPGGASLLAMPDTGSRIMMAVAGAHGAPGVEVSTLEAAVALAGDRAPEGSVALLSPAAPSFGAFRDFEERGERFRAAVLARTGR